MEFGAFVNFFGAKDGLVHVSQLARERVEKPGDVVKEGDTVKVKLLGFDDRGKVRLSMKVVDQATGADLSVEMGEEAEDRGPRREGGGGDRPRRGSDRGGRDRPRREASGD
jgi:polyribonucleotide nucleotidyltransferase